MDEFRRTFTVNEINKLAGRAAQVFVLSHELGFLRLLWDRIDQSKITSCAIQTGAPGIASLAAFDLEKATRPRNETDRMKMIQFIDATEGDPGGDTGAAAQGGRTFLPQRRSRAFCAQRSARRDHSEDRGRLD